MQSLNAIASRESLAVPPFHLDNFQDRVLDQMHLEFFFERCRVLITPSLRHVTTGEASREEHDQIRALLSQNPERVSELKRLVLWNLALHSALLETNSYYVAVNDHLVITRFVGREDGFEIKLYTLRPEDLPVRYADKIYLGRDLLVLDQPQRPHLGVGFLRDSLREQLVKLEGRLLKLATAAVADALRREFLGDLAELQEDVAAVAGSIQRDFPPLLPATLAEPQLLDLNHRFRELKHLLVDVDGVLAELEDRAFVQATPAARYVTKLRKDVTNDVNYVMMKVNGRIADHVNGIHL
jgi:hypothetical protein